MFAFLLPKILPFLFLSLLLLPPIHSTDPPLFQICSNTAGNYTANSTYETNLKSLLPSLSTNVTRIRFYNSTRGQSPNTIYAFALCRGDVNTSECRTCFETASQDIQQLCPSSKDAVVWYDQYLLRYSNLRIVSSDSNNPMFLMLNTRNVTNPARFIPTLRALLNSLATNASASPRKYAARVMNSTRDQSAYGLVQCVQDMTGSECNRCLQDAFDQIWGGRDRSQGGRVIGPSCNFRYEIYPFFASPPAQPPCTTFLTFAGSVKMYYVRCSGNLSPAECKNYQGNEISRIPEGVKPGAPLPEKNCSFVYQAADPLAPSHPSFTIPTDTNRSGKGRRLLRIIVFSTLGGFLGLCFLIFGIYCVLRRRKKGLKESSQEVLLQNTRPPTGKEFPYVNVLEGNSLGDQELPLIDIGTVQAATDNFLDGNKLGEGGFGSVYKGILPGGDGVAVKRLSKSSGEGLEEFKNEIMLIAKLQHRNLVRLLLREGNMEDSIGRHAFTLSGELCGAFSIFMRTLGSESFPGISKQVMCYWTMK